MQAWLVAEHGAPSDVLQFGTIEVPTPGPGQVVVRVRATARVILRTPGTLVVILVVGPPLSRSPAVARVVSHRWYSWFCAERLI